MSTSNLRLNFLVSGVLNVLLGAVLSAFLGTANAQAQNGTTFLNFQGMGLITDNPPTPTCVSSPGAYSFGDSRVVIYRFTLTAPTVVDALAFVSQRGVHRISSTQSPGFSLNGSATVDWDWINSRANHGTLSPSASNLLIAPGAGGSITAATGNIKIVGTINDFEGNAGCTVNFRAALTKRSD